VHEIEGAFAGGPFAAQQSFVRTVDVAEQRPAELSFALASSNPVEGEARFRFGLPAAAHVHLMVHDVTGRQATSLVDEVRGAGYYTASWSLRGAGAPTGIYFVRFTAGGRVGGDAEDRAAPMSWNASPP